MLAALTLTPCEAETAHRGSLYSLFVNRCRFLILGAALCLAGCVSIPDDYAPPVQRNPIMGPEPSPVGHFVRMTDPNAEAYFLRDVAKTTEAGSWRWVYQRPELVFRLSTTRHLRFAMDFAIPEMTFKQRGPVTISVFINNRLLEKLRYEKGGQFHFEKPVPGDWLRTDANTYVSMEIDKPWVAPEDGARLGFILSSAGFVQ